MFFRPFFRIYVRIEAWFQKRVSKSAKNRLQGNTLGKSIFDRFLTLFGGLKNVIFSDLRSFLRKTWIFWTFFKKFHFFHDRKFALFFKGKIFAHFWHFFDKKCQKSVKICKKRDFTLCRANFEKIWATQRWEWVFQKWSKKVKFFSFFQTFQSFIDKF